MLKILYLFYRIISAIFPYKIGVFFLPPPFFCKINTNFVQKYKLGRSREDIGSPYYNFYFCLFTELFTDSNLFKCLITIKCSKHQMKPL